MRYSYLKILALVMGCGAPGLAQELPANVRARAHGWYLSPSVAMLQTQRFETNSPLLLSAANNPLAALGLRLGYSHTPTLALELGFHALPNCQGFTVNPNPESIPRTYKNSGLYLPAALVWRLWQPAPRLAIRAVVGGGLYAQNSLGSFVDTLQYSAVPGGAWDGRLLVSQQGTSPRLRGLGEVGLRAEWQASPELFIGFEVKDLFALTGADDNTVAVTDQATRSLLAAAHIAARRQTLSAGVNVRWIIHQGTSYQYKPMQ